MSYHRVDTPRLLPHRLLILLLLLLTVVQTAVQADETTWVDPNSGEVVLLTSGKIQQSTAPLQTPVGLWPHGNRRDDDAAFFAKEDAAYEEWLLRVKEQKKQEEKQQREEMQNEGEKKNSKKESQKSITVELSPLAVKARADARWKLIKGLKNSSSVNVTSFENVRKLLEKDTLFLKEILSSDSLFAPDIAKDGSREEEYIHLINTVFSHTVVNMTSVKENTWVMEKISALPYPIVLDGEPVTRGVREVRIMEEESRRIETAWYASNITEKIAGEKINMTQIRENLFVSSTILNASRRAHQMVLSLVTPLLPYARQSLIKELHQVESKMSANDESTTALRQELKEYTRRKKMLVSFKEQLTSAERQIQRVHYSKSLLPKDVFVVALALIAKLRLGQDTGINGTDNIPRIGIWTDLTGALEEELKTLIFLPFATSLILVAATSWVLLGTREFWLRRIRRVLLSHRASLGDRKPKEQASFRRLCLRLNLLIEALIPFLLPAFFLYRNANSKKEEVSLYSIFLFSSPSQRLILGGIVVSFFLASNVVSSLMGTLYKYTSISKGKQKKTS
ncbi:putative 3-transmembrane protein A13 [Trypanosoma theileri]|uniref:Putative 3-transmembrane protein A13 n=1 Tax=Trypanosoma theileri TaxID=67003 RepID=A0A1X0P8Z7_9TRYP|nr:putative 3-transmembrane protein A13 [Trypanosoma theileri]ORC93103.1 putative 3-transmembrane protein A13 [Trypanosoma theileri]